MCEYSLHTIHNRLADAGEELVLHRFDTGTLGFASACDLHKLETVTKGESDGIWAILTDWLSPWRSAQLPAVCIPPGARLLLTDVPRNAQRSLCIASSEVVVCTELLSREYSYRDALLLPNSTRVLLQDLPEGIHAIVLSLSPEPSAKPANTEMYAA